METGWGMSLCVSWVALADGGKRLTGSITSGGRTTETTAARWTDKVDHWRTTDQRPRTEKHKSEGYRRGE